jgi:hypothetical protein
VLSTPDMGSRAECASFFELYVERSRRAGKALR